MLIHLVGTFLAICVMLQFNLNLQILSEIRLPVLSEQPPNGGGGEDIFLEGLLFEIWQYDVEHELHWLFYLALLSHSCVEYINFQRGFYLKFSIIK